MHGQQNVKTILVVPDRILVVLFFFFFFLFFFLNTLFNKKLFFSFFLSFFLSSWNSGLLAYGSTGLLDFYNIFEDY